MIAHRVEAGPPHPGPASTPTRRPHTQPAAPMPPTGRPPPKLPPPKPLSLSGSVGTLDTITEQGAILLPRLTNLAHLRRAGR